MTDITASYETRARTPRPDKPNKNADWPIIADKDEIPGWLHDNDYIIGGHPMPTHSYQRSLRLWICLHMETMNIWTHLLGFCLFVAAGGALSFQARSLKDIVTAGDIFAFSISITTAVFCFCLSTVFHTLRSHSYRVHHFWGRMDIMGICLLAIGGGVSATQYAWYCESTIRGIYWGLDVVSASSAAVILFDTGGGGSKMRILRGGVFSLLATSALLPVCHRTYRLGWSESMVQFGVQWFLAEAVCLLIGVAFFISRIPERLSPGSFDVWGHSHQLFHSFAIAGTAFHIFGLISGFNYRSSGMQHC